jgi:hypothetical protein
MTTITPVTVVTPADLSDDFDVQSSGITVIAATTTAAGKVRFATLQELSDGTDGVVVSPHDISAALSGQVPAIAGSHGVKIVLVDGVNTIESTLGDGSRTVLI